MLRGDYCELMANRFDSFTGSFSYYFVEKISEKVDQRGSHLHVTITGIIYGFQIYRATNPCTKTEWR